MVGNGTSHEIRHRISQNSGGSHSDSRSSISSTPYRKTPVSEDAVSVENGTANDNRPSGRSSIGNNTGSPGTPLGSRHEEHQPIIDNPTSIIRNTPIINNKYQYSISQQTIAREYLSKKFDKKSLRSRQTYWKTLGNM